LIYYFNFFSDEEYGEKSVSVLLDGEESELIFVDHPSGDMSVSASQLIIFHCAKNAKWIG